MQDYATKLLNADNQWQEIVSVTIKTEALKAYNLTVDQTHTYFIKGIESSEGVWVHNVYDLIPNINDYNKVVNGPGLSPMEKIAYKRQILTKVAAIKGWSKDSTLTQKNGRTVYKDSNDKNVLWAQDTQHGTFEKHDLKGNHLGEFDIHGNQTKPAGTHKLIVK